MLVVYLGLLESDWRRRVLSSDTGDSDWRDNLYIGEAGIIVLYWVAIMVPTGCASNVTAVLLCCLGPCVSKSGTFSDADVDADGMNSSWTHTRK